MTIAATPAASRSRTGSQHVEVVAIAGVSIGEHWQVDRRDDPPNVALRVAARVVLGVRLSTGRCIQSSPVSVTIRDASGEPS